MGLVVSNSLGLGSFYMHEYNTLTESVIFCGFVKARRLEGLM